MKVLFVSSGNSSSGISPIIKNQGESLRLQEVNISYFTIKGKGVKGYLKNVKPLKKFIHDNNFDIIHAHYSLSAFVASLAGAKPLVVSLMGSDVKSGRYFKLFIEVFNRLYWSMVIVKSEDMKLSLSIGGVKIIPNGVDFEKFKPINQQKCKNQLNWDLSKKQILFAANPKRPEKNYNLTLEAIELLHDKNIELKFLKDIPNEMMPIYYNAADVVLLSSLWEGSPNVIKEAMACNVPIVSTDVGDVRKVIGDTEGCYITSFDPRDVAEKIKMALEFAKTKGRTKGRERLIELGLDSKTIAKRIISVYEKALGKNGKFIDK